MIILKIQLFSRIKCSQFLWNCTELVSGCIQELPNGLCCGKVRPNLWLHQSEQDKAQGREVRAKSFCRIHMMLTRVLNRAAPEEQQCLLNQKRKKKKKKVNISCITNKIMPSIIRKKTGILRGLGALCHLLVMGQQKVVSVSSFSCVTEFLLFKG